MDAQSDAEALQEIAEAVALAARHPQQKPCTVEAFPDQWAALDRLLSASLHQGRSPE